MYHMSSMMAQGGQYPVPLGYPALYSSHVQHHGNQPYGESLSPPENVHMQNQSQHLKSEAHHNSSSHPTGGGYKGRHGKYQHQNRQYAFPTHQQYE